MLETYETDIIGSINMPKKGERLNDRGKTLVEEMERFTRESNELLMQLVEEIKAGS